jgi:glyoxylase-like metal-dependent hydrolase (beta-lactamase superfamily II)
MKFVRGSSFAIFLVAVAAPAAAQLNNLDEALRTTPITTQQLAENFHVLFGVGGNILVSIGANGVLIVDDQFPQMVPKYKAKIGELGGGAVNFAINTHWHFDHADGNQTLGPEGTWLVAHETSRQMMMKNNVINLVTQKRDQPAYAETAWPVLTYDDTMRFHFIGERIDLMHFGPAHTTGDTAVTHDGLLDVECIEQRPQIPCVAFHRHCLTVRVARLAEAAQIGCDDAAGPPKCSDLRSPHRSI